MKKSLLKTYVGFGFGPIQLGLFLYEAFQSGNFRRFVVSEVDQELVSAIRSEGGFVNLNIAYKDHRESVRFGPIDILNPNERSDQEKIISAICEATEIGTAVPSVNNYDNSSPDSIVKLLAKGISKKIHEGGPLCVIYTAENNNRAAEILERTTYEYINDKTKLSLCENHMQFLNTIIGKMCHKVALYNLPLQQGLVPIVDGYSHAILVESFNSILISKIAFSPLFKRGIQVFQEVEDLHPYEELKLFGHNAIHALLGYLGKCIGVESMASLRDYPEVMNFAMSAFLDEIGNALCDKYFGIGDIFTKDGFYSYALDLLNRMTHPLLMDRIDRLTRDVDRKLGWNDRLIGSIRLCLQTGFKPEKLSLGAAAALYEACNGQSNTMRHKLDENKIRWMEATDQQCEVESVCNNIRSAIDHFIKWEDHQFELSFLNNEHSEF